MKSSSSVTTSNCRLTMQSGTMHSAAGDSLPPAAASNQSTLLPDTSANTPRCPRLNPKDLGNSDFVNRLLAATRITDFYSAAPHSFFYSEMLRSLVQSRNDSADRDSQQQVYNNSQQFQRRSRKRAWPHRFPEITPSENILHNADVDFKPQKTPKRHDPDKYPEVKGSPEDQRAKFGKDEKAPESLIFPPTHTAPWYQPYPPFFIDLRVSGHIYDNNNETKTTPSPPIGLDPKARQGSAFTVPQPSRNSMAPINLTTNQESSLFKSDKRLLFKDANNNGTEGFGQDGDDVKHRSYSKLRFESNDDVIAVVDDNDS